MSCLTVHQQGNHEYLNVKCRYCVINHLNEETQFNCINCNLQFTETDNLPRHFKRIHVGRKLPCSLCSYKATKREVLISHQVPKSIADFIYINIIKGDLWAVKYSCDVTLVDDEDVQTPAHKVILIALSLSIRNR